MHDEREGGTRVIGEVIMRHMFLNRRGPSTTE